jgi:hypothetical protein
VWPDQLRWSVQQPGVGRSMIDGPGPPGTDTVAVCVLPASLAVMTSGFGATSGILDTQRILRNPAILGVSQEPAPSPWDADLAGAAVP